MMPEITRNGEDGTWNLRVYNHLDNYKGCKFFGKNSLTA